MKFHDPQRLVLRRAIRVLIAFPIAFALSTYVLNLGIGALFTAFGVFAVTTFAEFGGSMRRRARAYVWTGIAGAVLIAIGAVIAHRLAAAIVGSFVVAFAVFYSGVLRGHIAASSIAVLLPFIITVTLGPGDLQQLFVSEVGWLVGAAFSLGAALVIWPAQPTFELRTKIADTLRAAARATRAVFPDGPPLPDGGAGAVGELNDSFVATRATYLGRLTRPGGVTLEDRALIQLVDQLDRIRTILRWQIGLATSEFHEDIELAETSARAMEQCAAALVEEAPAPDPAVIDEARSRHRQLLRDWTAAAFEVGQASSVIPRVDVGFRVRTVAANAELACINTLHARGIPTPPSARDAWDANAVPRTTVELQPRRVLREQLTLRSPWTRNSLRAAAAVAMATAIAALLGVEHGFWVVLGAIAALRFDATGTGRTAIQVICGTVIGFVVSVGVLFLFGDTMGYYWILLPFVAAFATYATGAISPLVGQAAFTVFLLTFFAIILGPQLSTGEIRVVDVALGMAASLTMSALLWPRGVSVQVVESLREAMDAATECLVSAYDYLLEGAHYEGEAREKRARASAAAARAQDVLDLSLIQASPHAFDIRAWATVSNCSAQLIAAAGVVAGLSRMGFGGVNCPEVADTMLATAHHLRARLGASLREIHSLHRGDVVVVDEDDAPPADVDGAMLGDPIPRLRAHVEDCVNSIKPPFPPNAGAAVSTLIWAKDWLVHLDWVAGRVAMVRPVDRVAPAGAAGPGGSAGPSAAN